MPLLKHLELATTHVAHEEWLRIRGASVDVTLTPEGAWVAVPGQLIVQDVDAKGPVRPLGETDEFTVLLLKHAFPTLLSVLEHAGRLGCTHVHFTDEAPVEASLDVFP